jgi:hypothetical protein
MSSNIANAAFIFTAYSIAMSIVLTSVSVVFLNGFNADAESLSVTPDEMIDTLNVTGTFRSVQTSEVENSSAIKNGHMNSSNFGSWRFSLENGKFISFDAILNTTDVVPARSYNIDSFRPSTEKYVQLGSRGTDIIRGIANVTSEGNVIEPNIGLSIMIIDLNKTNFIFDDSNKLKIKSPIIGSIDSMVNSKGELIEIDSSNVTSMRNSTGTDEQQLGEVTLLEGLERGSDKGLSSDPQFAGDDESGSASDDESSSAGDDGSDPGYEEY